MTTRSPYTVTAGHRCKVCGTVERVSKRAQEPPVDDKPTVISEAETFDLLVNLNKVLSEMPPLTPEQEEDAWNAVCAALALPEVAALAALGDSLDTHTVSEGASAPGSRDLPDEQALDRSQPSETDFKCDSCDRTSPTRAGIVAHQRSHAGTIGPTGESGD